MYPPHHTSITESMFRKMQLPNYLCIAQHLWIYLDELDFLDPTHYACTIPFNDRI